MGGKDRAIVQSIVELGRGFGIRVTAEGIESLACMHQLIRLGCEAGQGYYIGRPMDAEAFIAWLNDW